MRQIAIYGKGGIGKSTIAAHLSAALALTGARVIQIGCDPKHDSTRLLTGGRAIPTTLDYLKVTNPLKYRAGDILFEGFGGVGCVEAGGPTPGVGCAGRGIISTFELLEQFDIAGRYDLALYDVLGDVVCGGFAVPIRSEYADTVFIVTSGGFMSIYAANNILRGVKNYDHGGPRVAGILYNRGSLPGEDERVAIFAEAVGLPVVAALPRSESFAKAEKEGRTLIESGGDEAICALFEDLALRVKAGIPKYKATPLEDDELEERVLQRSFAPGALNNAPAVTGAENVPLTREAGNASVSLASPNRYLSKNLIHSEPLHGCAFNGAVSMCLHIADAVVLAHAPKSCAYLSYQSVSSAGRRGLFERGALLPVAISPNLECTEMREADMIFGGMELLEHRLEEVRRRGPAAVIIVSACPAGIIGDDIERFESAGEEDGPPVVALKTDGNISGDYLQGMLTSFTTLARRFIRKDAPTVPDTVNVVFEKVVARNTNPNFEVMEGFLARLGVAVNCRFLCETTVERLRNFCSAPLNLLAFKDYTGRMLQDFFEKEYGCNFLEEAFPVGYDETARWLREVARFFGRAPAAEDIIREQEREYSARVGELRPRLRGKRLMVITYNRNLDWILKTAIDLGIEIVKIGILNFSQDVGFSTRLDARLNIEENYDREKRPEDLRRLAPDILLSNYEFPGEGFGGVMDTIPMCPDVGFFSGLALAERWAAMLKMNLMGEWRQDERLFKKYYAG